MKTLPTPINIYGWNGYQLSTDAIKIIFAPEIGGRIISLKYQNEELFFVDKDHVGETFNFNNIDNLEHKKQQLGFRLWGGDKTWVAPESSWTQAIPPLELDAAPYTVELHPNRIIMTSPICRETGLQIIREIILNENGEIILNQTLINESQSKIQCAIWDVTQLLRPFEILIPTAATNIQPDLRFKAGTDQRHRFITQKNNQWSKITCDQAIQFKYGSQVNQGVAMAMRQSEHRILTMTRRFEIYPETEYPNNNMVEVYNASAYPYLELEILAPLTTLNPGDKTTHQRIWQIKHFDK